MSDVCLSICEAKRKTEIARTPLTQLSFVSLLGRKGDMVAYVHSDRSTGVSLCHLFRAKPKLTKLVPHAVNEAFQSAKAKRPSARRAWTDAANRGSVAGDANGGNGAAQAGPAPATAAAPATGAPGAGSTAAASAASAASVPVRAASTASLPPHAHPSRTSSVVSLAPAAEVEQIFKARYLGHTTVTQPSGESVVADAVKMVKRTSRARKVKVVLTSQVLQLQDRRTSEVLQQALISEVSYTSPRRKRFSFITTDVQNIMFCHTLRFRSKRRCVRLNKALATVFVTASEAAKLPGEEQGALQHSTE